MKTLKLKDWQSGEVMERVTLTEDDHNMLEHVLLGMVHKRLKEKYPQSDIDQVCLIGVDMQVRIEVVRPAIFDHTTSAETSTIKDESDAQPQGA